MRVLGGFAAGLVVGCWVGVVVTVLVYEAIGRAVTLPGKVVVPDSVPEAWTVDR